MHLAILVIGHGILLQTVGDGTVVNDYSIILPHRFIQQFQDIEQLTGITTAVSEQSPCLFYLKLLLLQQNILFYHPLHQV